ncbi:chitin synthase chs-2-like [Leptopilina heterotoma]|uniref:chitin synthase chs-2-like n=1 Tax=Leptopilina heterotoma TaxID=63436 RepID=UPI001CA8C0EE|nr:chitin synthase chs-2-like [Leptopilina heterotoma]
MSNSLREIFQKTDPRVQTLGDYKKSINNNKNVNFKENHNERHETEMHLWDVFKQFPPRPKSGSTVEHKGYEFFIKCLKVFVYLIIFSAILSFSVISKFTILFATTNINLESVHFCNSDENKSSDEKLLANLPQSGRIAWMWCIIMAFIIPEVLGIISAIKACIFKNIKMDEFPSFVNFVFSIFIEILHSVGMALLFLVCLPNLNVLQAASIMSCICFVPSLLAFIGTGTKYYYSRQLKNLLPVLADGFAFALQITGLLASIFFQHRDRSESMYILPVALILSSLRWWPNYVSSEGKSESWLSKIKNDLEPTRFCLQGVTAIVRIIVFIMSALLIAYFKNYDLTQFFNGFLVKEYSIPVTNSAGTTVISLNKSSSVQFNFLIIHAFSSVFAYAFGKFACKTLMHKFGFALPLVLSTPTINIILLFGYISREKNTCAFHGFIPDYLFFDVPYLESFEMIVSEWYLWLSIFLWISQVWITFHTWTSNCERLAKAEHIFVILTYDSLIIDQCLSLNRRRERKLKYTGVPLKKDNDVKVDESLTFIKVCATMWHETENEMNKLISSILRLDRDNCAMRVVQEHFDVRIPDYYDLEGNI